MNGSRAASDLTHGYVAALLAAAVLSTTAVLIRYLTANFGIPPLVLAFWREAFTALSLLLILAAVRPSLIRVPRSHLRYLSVYGLVFALFNSVWTLSVAVNGAAIATVLVYCSTAFTVILASWFLRERLDWAKALAVLLSLLGCSLVSGVSGVSALGSSLVGVMIGVVSGLGYAVYSLMGRSATQKGLNPWTTVLYTFGIASVCLLTFNLLGESILPGAAVHHRDLFCLGSSINGWGILFFLAAGPTLTGFGLYNTSLVYLPSGAYECLMRCSCF